MFSLGAARYYLYREPTDMRKSFDGLCGLVSGRLGQSPMSGDVFIFINKPRNRIKLLRWEAGGFVLFYKRLESGMFELPTTKAVGLSAQINQLWGTGDDRHGNLDKKHGEKEAVSE
jgi:transposase